MSDRDGTPSTEVAVNQPHIQEQGAVSWFKFKKVEPHQYPTIEESLYWLTVILILVYGIALNCIAGTNEHYISGWFKVFVNSARYSVTGFIFIAICCLLPPLLGTFDRNLDWRTLVVTWVRFLGCIVVQLLHPCVTLRNQQESDSKTG